MTPAIIDNSFLLEEAFNQQINEVQFIQKYNTQFSELTSSGEIPLWSESHQFSYSAGELRRLNPILSYRYQSVNAPKVLLAHRFGGIIPIQDEQIGFEYVQAATFILNDQWMNHWNLGLYHYPRNKGRTQNAINAGTSVVFYAQENLNLLMEAYLATDENYESKFIINPGLRSALTLNWQETQIVPGISFPISFNQDSIDTGVIFYLSCEPKF